MGEGCYKIRVSDIIRLQKLFISVNTPFTRGFWAKIPVYESYAAGAILGDFGKFWAFRACFCINTPLTRAYSTLNFLLQTLFPVNGFCPILVQAPSKRVGSF